MALVRLYGFGKCCWSFAVSNRPLITLQSPRTDKCDLFCLFKKTPIPGKQCFQAAEVDNIVEDRLKFSLGWPNLKGVRECAHPSGGIYSSAIACGMFLRRYYDWGMN